ncbi:immunoglobulin domain-containing protein [Ereboglobus luteus]|uniref:Ig-like domain-containing protein n=1 Tax=Ereboglobus luteus TaxID=1796921 RepID=A0A2U8E189_9BACT|nr:immunoglobulin domain-containing protein [Ereboglobus luteus]AWI08623.1 hypothetical protein CKA38_04560 [Ereboglobus luteus]
MKRVCIKIVGLAVCALIIVIAVLLLARREQGTTPTVAQTKSASGVVAQSDLAAPAQSAFQSPQQEPKTFAADALWQLTPRNVEPPAPAVHSDDAHHAHATHSVVVADLDTSAAAVSLPNVKAGDDIELALPNGEITRGHVNLVQNDNGVLRLGGSLPDKTNGSFALTLNQQSQLMGMILLRDVELAYTIEPGAQGGLSHIEASALSDVICHPYEDPPESPDDAGRAPDSAQAFAAAPADAPVALASVPIRSSRPSAPAVLYLDFDGATVTDPYWNKGDTIYAAAANLTEAQIEEAWKGVAEAYSPFNIDVTTDPARYASTPVGKRMRCIITPTYQWYTNSTGVRGVALVNSFTRAGVMFANDTPCWIFVPSWYSYIPLVTAHELGHTFGLRHDGLSAASPRGRQEYFGGHGSGAMSWGPIMGNPSYRNVNQWSKGEYAYASNTEDDLAIITSATNGITYYNDGVGKTRATATAITIPASGNTTKQGVITTSAHEAWFTFTLTAEKTVSLSAAPNDVVPKFDISMQLQNATGTVLASDNPSLALNALIEKKLSAGKYYIKLKGAAYGDGIYEGYPVYGSIGQYTLIGRTAPAIVAPTITTHPQSKTATTEDASFTLTAAASGGGTLRYQWQKNGVDLVSNAQHPDVTSVTLTVLSPTASDAGQYTLKVRNAGGEVTSNAAAITVTAPPPPVITGQPQNATAIANHTYSVYFSVSATGAGYFTYQWQKDGSNIADISSKRYGTASSYLQIYNPTDADKGAYRVIVSNQGGSTTSAVATLDVTPPPPPVITAQPEDITKTEGDFDWSYGSVTLTVSASSVTPPSYQWKKNGVALTPSDQRITSTTSGALNISKYIVSDSGTYAVTVSNAGGSVTSADAIITILPPVPPMITSQPVSATALDGGGRVSLSVYATGQALRYQWQKDGVDIEGATSATYYIWNPDMSYAGEYTVKVWNSSGTLVSAPATLTVNLPPVPIITQQPSPINLCEGKYISIEARASSQSNYTCQWFKDGQPIQGATGISYGKTIASLSDAGEYKVVVTNPGGSVTSNEVSVVVTPAIPPRIIVQPENQRVYAGGNAILLAVAEGNPAPTYSWCKNGAQMYGATRSSLTVPNIQPGNTGTYHVVATNIAGSATSSAIVISAEPMENGNAVALIPSKKHIGPGRVVYQLQARTNTKWTASTDSTWLALSQNEGCFTATIEVTVAPNPLPIERVAIISIAGLEHTITQAAAGTPIRELWAVGSNASGQLGDNALLQADIPTYIADNIKAVATGGLHTLILKNDGTLWTVGNNGSGQLGTGSYTSTATPVKIAEGVATIAAAGTWSSFIKEDGSLWGMGSNGSGQISADAVSRINVPVQIATSVRAVAAGDAHILFLKTDNTLWSMGENTYGQLGDGTTTARRVPVQIASGVKFVCASGYTSAYIKNDDTLWQFGHNYYGGFGDGSVGSYSDANPTPRQTAAHVSAVSLSANHSVILKTDGALFSSGCNYSGQLGEGSTWNKYTYEQVATDVAQVLATTSASIFVKTDGSLWGMGTNSNGMFPGMPYKDFLTPVCMARDILSASAGGNCLFMFMKDGSVYACGNDSSGQLGSGISSPKVRLRTTPIQVDSDVVSIAAGGSHSMYVKADKSLWVAGGNQYNVLGISGHGNTATPVQTASDVMSAGAGDNYSMHIKSDGTVYGVGRNYERQIGSSSDYAAHMVSDVHHWTSVATDARSLSLGGSHTLVGKSDGSMWGMGYANTGALGDKRGFYENFYTPRKILSGVVAMAAGGGHSLYIKNDGTLWGRGNNYNNQLENSSQSVIAPAIQIASNAKAVMAGSSHSLWIDDNGVLWALGFNYYGQLGCGSVSSVPSPISVANDVKAASTNATHTLYITKDNRLLGMGSNSSGQLGNEPNANASTPVDVAVNVEFASAGGSHTLFIATGDIRLDPPPPPVITGFSPTSITAQTKVVITGSNFNKLAGVYFGSVEADHYTVDSPTQITVYAPVIPTQDAGHVYVGTFDGVAVSAATYSAVYAPVLGDRIEDQYINLGDNLSIEPPVLGTPDPTITWQISTNNGTTWTNLAADANHSIDAHGVLKITNAPLSIDGNLYRFTATNIHDTVTSQAFKVVIMYQPVVMAQPASRTVTVGASATFLADIDGVPAPELQWQISTDSGLTWTDIDGATNATHTIAATSAAMNNNRYRLVATNECGSVTTNAATLTVQWAPVQNNHVSSQVGVTGGSVTFFVSIDANPAPTSYQWQVSTNGGGTWTNLSNGSTVSGANTASLVLSNATASMNGYRYRCVVSNGVGAGLTTAATSLAVIDSMFATPSGLFIASGTLYVSDADAHTIHRVTLSTGKATLFAGAVGQSGTANSTTGTNARFNSPTGLVFTQADKLVYVLDTGNNALRRITTAGSVTRVYQPYDFGDASGITITPADTLFITETQKHTISRIYNTGSGLMLSTVSGAAGVPGAEDYYGSSARYREPSALAKIPGNSGLVIADTGNHTIRVTYYDTELASPSYFYTYVLAGLAGQLGSLDGSGTAARFSRPAGIAASVNYIYVADTGNHTIRRVSEYGSVTTLAGIAGQAGYSNGTGTNARFNKPTALALDSTYQNLYIADSNNSVIRKLNLATNEVTTLIVSATGSPVSPPVITKHPQNITATQGVGGPLTLTFTATGAGTLTSVWQKDGGNITASNHYMIDANSLKIYNHTTTDSGQYRVIVSNEGGSVTSNPATVTVNPTTSGTNTGGNSGNNSDSGGGGGGGAPSLWLLVALGVLVAMRGRWRL